jgi:hypothetical protein
MAAVTAVLVSATLPVVSGPAWAATHSLTVTTLNRGGAKVTTAVKVMNLSTNAEYTLKSGKARKLPKGSYSVLVDIATAKDSTDTLGARTVKVSGATKTTFDARKGKVLKVTLDSGPAAEHTQELQAAICTAGDNGDELSVGNSAGKIYVIPNASKKFQLAYQSAWRTGGLPGDVYVTAAQTTGLPTKPGKAFKRASLGTVNVAVRRGPGGSPQADVLLQAPEKSCTRHLYDETIASDTAPYRIKAHVSAGKWGVNTATSAEDHGQSVFLGHWYSSKNVKAGKTYSQTFYRSAWGPGTFLPTVLYKTLVYNTSGAFRDPGLTDYWGSEASQRSVSTLTLGGKVLVKKTNVDWEVDRGTFEYGLKKPGWYTLDVTSKRYRPGVKYPADMLSTASGTTFRFYANPKKNLVASVFSVRLLPNGLDMLNRAKPGTVTTVDLKPAHVGQYPDATLTKIKVKSVSAKASFDGGKTWKVVTVRRSGSTWRALIANPASGTVSLRAKVTEAKGNSTEVTIIRAYAIG